jgi:hypothetical protein
MLTAMGLFDTILILDDGAPALCPDGHRVASLQTKDLDPDMSTYLVHEGKLSRVARSSAFEEAEGGWRVEGRTAVHERRAELEPISAPLGIRAYGTCSACEPLLVRTDGRSLYGDIVDEHVIFVDFDLEFRPAEPVQITRTSGTRDELRQDLLARGMYVLGDDEPLAIAHRELRAARARASEDRPRRGRFGKR